MTKSSMLMMLGMALFACAAPEVVQAPGGPSAEATNPPTGTVENALLLQPGDVVGAVRPFGTDILYPGTSAYQALSFSVASVSNVTVTVTTKTPGHTSLAWIVDANDPNKVFASDGPQAAFSIVKRLDPGAYLVVFRDALKQSSVIHVGVDVQPIAAVTGPSFLLPPGKNGAAAHASFTCSANGQATIVYYTFWQGWKDTARDYASGTLQAGRECDGVLAEDVANHTLDYVPTTCTDSKPTTTLRAMTYPSWVTLALDADGPFRRLSAFTYVRDRDEYQASVGKASGGTLTIAPTSANAKLYAYDNLVNPDAPISRLVDASKDPFQSGAFAMINWSCSVVFTY